MKKTSGKGQRRLEGRCCDRCADLIPTDDDLRLCDAPTIYTSATLSMRLKTYERELESSRRPLAAVGSFERSPFDQQTVMTSRSSSSCR